MLIDDELIPKQKESNKRKTVKIIYYLTFSSLLILVWFRNFYLFYITKDLKSMLSLGNAVELFNNNIIICLISFIMTFLGFIKAIDLNAYLKIFSFIGIIISLFFTFGPIRDFLVERILEMRTEN